MPKYEVIRPWHGVEVGHVFNAELISPALASHVRALKSDLIDSTDVDGVKLIPATPDAISGSVCHRPDDSNAGVQIDGQGLEPANTGADEVQLQDVAAPSKRGPKPKAKSDPRQSA